VLPGETRRAKGGPGPGGGTAKRKVNQRHRSPRSQSARSGGLVPVGRELAGSSGWHCRQSNCPETRLELAGARPAAIARTRELEDLEACRTLASSSAMFRPTPSRPENTSPSAASAPCVAGGSRPCTEFTWRYLAPAPQALTRMARYGDRRVRAVPSGRGANVADPTALS
jgi:hypothetical protein